MKHLPDTAVLTPHLQAQKRQHQSVAAANSNASLAAVAPFQQLHPAGQLTTAAAQHSSSPSTRHAVACKAGRLPTVAFFGRSDPELTVVKLQVRGSAECVCKDLFLLPSVVVSLQLISLQNVVESAADQLTKL